jgi:hypothetical protein
MKSMGYAYDHGRWVKEPQTVKFFSWRNLLKEALCFILIMAIAFTLAFLFVEGWDAQNKIDLDKTKARIESMLYDQADTPERPEGRKLPTYFSEGEKYSTGHEYYRAKAERGR